MLVFIGIVVFTIVDFICITSLVNAASITDKKTDAELRQKGYIGAKM